MSADLLLDVGGTGIKGTVLRADGQTEPLREFPACSDASRDPLLAHFAHILLSLAGGEIIRKIAMAFPGPFDYEKGIPLMRGLAKYESLFGVALPEALEGLNICPEKWYFINDVSAYALGAASFLPTEHRALAICLGTGAGSAFLINGLLCEDKEESVPDKGWIYPLPFQASIVDDYLSDRGIRRLSREILGTELSPGDLNRDDAVYQPVWQAFGRNLVQALLPVAEAFRATDLVFGGKISLAWHLFGAEMQAACGSRSIRILVRPDTEALTVRGLSRIIQ